MKRIKLVTIIIALFCGVSLYSQEVPEITFHDKLDQTIVDNVRPLMNQLFQDYQRYATLYDDELGSNAETVNRFYRLRVRMHR